MTLSSNADNRQPLHDPVAQPVHLSSDLGPLHGWLMGVQGYQQGLSAQTHASDAQLAHDNNPSLVRKSRPLSISSITSEDSVDLDDLIRANYTSDVEDEIDLPDLAGLDLDDSDEEFWKMKESPTAHIPTVTLSHASGGQPPSQADGDLIHNGRNAASDDRLETLSNSSYSSLSHTAKYSTGDPELHPRQGGIQTRHRSGSHSSENSFTSQSTITANQTYYGRRGLPVAQQHPSDSTSSHASRPSSQLSNHSSHSPLSHLPRPRTQHAYSATHSPPTSPTHSDSPIASSSFALGRAQSSHEAAASRSSRYITSSSLPQSTVTSSKITKRASHIPAPSGLSRMSTASPAPQQSLSTRSSSSLSQHSRLPTARASSRIGNRASHIPMTSSSQRALSPPPAPSRLGVFGARGSVFGAATSTTASSNPRQVTPSESGTRTVTSRSRSNSRANTVAPRDASRSTTPSRIGMRRT